MGNNPTRLPAERAETTPQPWQSWGDTVRWMLIATVPYVLCIVLMWLVHIRW